ncbi:MAG: hypothetical protein HYX92_03020 [Chloroflexi bacterium]|nr:hypothetical protein [Chloroflexota bacterium]
MTREIQDILDECIDRIYLRGESLDACLKDFPGREAELFPLLQVAKSLSRVAGMEPTADFKAQTRYRLQMAMSRRKKPASGGRPLIFGWRRRWAPAAAAVAVVFLIGGGTVGAANGSLPGDPLYGIKVATENVQLAVTPSEASRIILHMSFVDNRVRELTALAELGRPTSMGDLTERLDHHLATVKEAAATGAIANERIFSRRDKQKLHDLLEINAVRHMSVLENVMDKAPEQARPSLQRAMLVSERGYETALTASGGNLERVRSQWSRMRRWMGRAPGGPGSAGGLDGAPAPSSPESRYPGAGPRNWPQGRGPQLAPDPGPGMMGPGQSQNDSNPQPPSDAGPGMMGPGAGQGAGTTDAQRQAPPRQPSSGWGPGMMGPGAGPTTLGGASQPPTWQPPSGMGPGMGRGTGGRP